MYMDMYMSSLLRAGRLQPDGSSKALWTTASPDPVRLAPSLSLLWLPHAPRSGRRAGPPLARGVLENFLLESH